ncbi:MAG: hypothetical protein LBE53_04795 [Paucimonas sp.]|jgi:hypothetical protein|nr:hypothetical protein [Paucimonas sp.]
MEQVQVEKIFDDYYGFDDGVMRAFEYQFSDDGKLNVRIELYARNHELDGNVWRRVDVMIIDVLESRSIFEPAQFTNIQSKVKLLRFEGEWCVEVNCDFGMLPISPAVIRKYSKCYVVGRSVEALEFLG